MNERIQYGDHYSDFFVTIFLDFSSTIGAAMANFILLGWAGLWDGNLDAERILTNLSK